MDISKHDNFYENSLEFLKEEISEMKEKIENIETKIKEQYSRMNN